MKCARHPESEAVFTCAGCGAGLCDECAVRLGGEAWCKVCLGRMVSAAREQHHAWTWRKIAAACLSIIPGAGHMFLGLIGKGFALMGLLFAAIFVIILYADSTAMYWIIAYLVPCLSVLFLCYAVFDSMAVADAQKAGRDPEAAADDTLKAIWERFLTNRRTLGWVVLIAGAVGILSLFSTLFSDVIKTRLSFEIPLGGFVLPAILLVVGILMIRRGRKGR